MERTRLSDFDYGLPPELIAQEPVTERDRSRMMVLQRNQDAVEHKHFTAFPEYLRAGDLLVMNNTGLSRPACSGRGFETGEAGSYCAAPLRRRQMDRHGPPGRNQTGRRDPVYRGLQAGSRITPEGTAPGLLQRAWSL